MPRLTPEELRRLREEAARGLYLRDGDAAGRVIVHMGSCGIAAGAREIEAAFSEELQRLGLSGIRLVTSGCAGFCSREPMATVELRGSPPVTYGNLDPARARSVVERHITGGKVVSAYAIGVGSERGA